MNYFDTQNILQIFRDTEWISFILFDRIYKVAYFVDINRNYL